jgi:hypothetical protein
MGNLNKVCLILVISLLLVFLSLQTSLTYAEESSVQEKALSILSNVLELDMSKYEPELSSYVLNKPQDYGLNDMFGGLPDEILEYTLKSAESNLSASFRFVNKTMVYCSLSPLDDAPMLYAKQVPADTLEETKGLVQKLQVSSPSTQLQEMQTTLDMISEAKPANVTSGNIKLQIINADSSTEYSWWRTVNGVDFPTGLYIYFVDGTLSKITDFSSFYKIGDTNVKIDRDIALSIAKENANKINKLNVTLEDGSIKEVTLDLHDEPSIVQLKAEQRELFTWYPYWRIQFWSDNPIGGTDGIEVGIWADTGELATCQLTGHHGAIPDADYSSLSTPSFQPSEDSQQTNNNTIIYLIAGTAAVASLAIVLTLAIRKRSK